MPVPNSGLKGLLSMDKCQCLDVVLDSVARLRKALDDCRDCGLDVGEAIAQNESNGELAKKLKSKLFPEMP